MNSHKHKDDALDRSLRRSLQNWAARQHPPSDGRNRLLRAALQSSSDSNRKNSTPAFMFLHAQDVPLIRFNGLAHSSALVLSQGFDTWQVQFQVSQSFTARLVC